MAKRFFKLLYILTLIGIAISMPIYLLSSIQFDKIVISSYKAKCISNGEYVVLQGAPRGLAWVFDEISLNDSIYSETKKDLNFYCKYSASIEPYIAEYIESETREERTAANIHFFNFRDSVISNVYSYPPAYTLELIGEETHLYELYSPIVVWLLGATLAFVILQFLRMCYTYIVFGKVVWHPFKQNITKKSSTKNV